MVADDEKKNRPTDDDRYESWAEKLEKRLDDVFGPKK